MCLRARTRPIALASTATSKGIYEKEARAPRRITTFPIVSHHNFRQGQAGRLTHEVKAHVNRLELGDGAKSLFGAEKYLTLSLSNEGWSLQ